MSRARPDDKGFGGGLTPASPSGLHNYLFCDDARACAELPLDRGVAPRVSAQPGDLVAFGHGTCRPADPDWPSLAMRGLAAPALLKFALARTASCRRFAGSSDFAPFRGRRGLRRPVEHDLTAIAAAHRLETFEEPARGQAVGDDLAHVKAAFQHRDHLVPGLEHLAAVDALEGQLLEDDLVPVDEHRLR